MIFRPIKAQGIFGGNSLLSYYFPIVVSSPVYSGFQVLYPCKKKGNLCQSILFYMFRKYSYCWRHRIQRRIHNMNKLNKMNYFHYYLSMDNFRDH